MPGGAVALDGRIEPGDMILVFQFLKKYICNLFDILASQ
jgi:hypothetical protein